MSSSPVLLLLGAGPNVGHHVSLAFASLGYRIALASRTPPKQPAGPHTTHFRTDLSDPSAIPALFANVTQTLGTPSVVVYNGTYALESFRTPN
jgi:NAD(P)-dependent dehydrogenase (short-subunit alcohol dehydrogenase family)